MRSQKGSHRINVGAVEYRWRASGNDGYIIVGIWPVNNIGPFIQGTFRYHESSSNNQIIITNRIVRRIIEHAIASCDYNPQVRGIELNLKLLDDVIKWDDAVRGKSVP